MTDPSRPTRRPPATPAQRAAAVALSAQVGQRQAARRLGMPQRTLSDWEREPSASAVIREVEAGAAIDFRAGLERALGALHLRLADPTARVGELARAVEVLSTQLALMEGRATANVAVSGASGMGAPGALAAMDHGDLTKRVYALTPADREALRRALAQCRDELEPFLTPEQEAEIRALLAGDGGDA